MTNEHDAAMTEGRPIVYIRAGRRGPTCPTKFASRPRGGSEERFTPSAARPPSNWRIVTRIGKLAFMVARQKRHDTRQRALNCAARPPKGGAFGRPLFMGGRRPLL